ncbi:NAD(P)-dependent alcohol dehydrogenase [Methylocystis iwaonis]|uniref:NAD(P)-dependent alcohol dehydrogenase n=1 Tax=Methylocystis iwaonis TaxID=2885079 RepID=UPI002E7ACF79|nr:NAD(P)-dependent alcohol dehydrogenase [Methylocystis iwaonis]
MTIKAFGYAAHSATAPLVPFHFERRDPLADDVTIEILYCGVCHSDLHQARNDWNNSIYPMVPGHEIIGRVVAVGPQVTRFKVGDHAGVGCMVDSCLTCEPCEQGQEQFCNCVPTFTYNALDKNGQPTQGGYSDRIVVKERFVVNIPDGVDLAGAAPLLCAGITTYSPLRHWKVGPGSKVAVTGLGGLGHMAIKLAKALGAQVALFTRSPGKAEDAKRLGADEIIVSTDEAQMAGAAGKFDLIIDTVPSIHDLNPYLPTLAIDGTLVLVGYLGGLEPALGTVPLIMGRRSVAGSLIGGMAETQELFDFCATHGVVSDVEVIAMQEINAAYERMLKSDVKYRFVIDMASLKA